MTVTDTDNTHSDPSVFQRFAETLGGTFRRVVLWIDAQRVKSARVRQARRLERALGHYDKARLNAIGVKNGDIAGHVRKVMAQEYTGL